MDTKTEPTFNIDTKADPTFNVDTNTDHGDDNIQKVEKLSIGSIYLERETKQMEYVEQPEVPVLEISTFEDSDNKYFHSENADLRNSFKIGGQDVFLKRIVAEGWLYKKGSGFDMILSQRWKRRWAQLVVLQDAPQVPCLLIYWNRNTDKPSTLMPLTGAVVIGHDHDGGSEQPHTLTIIPDGGVTRTFAAAKKERDEWIHVVNVIVNDFQQRMSKMETEERE